MKMFLSLIFLLTVGKAEAQVAVEWIIPTTEKYENAQFLAKGYYIFTKQNKNYLVDEQGEVTAFPTGKFKPLRGDYFLWIQGERQGVYHAKKGVTVPAVYERIKAINSQVLEVKRYGMTAGISYENELIIPYGYHSRVYAFGNKKAYTKRGDFKVSYQNASQMDTLPSFKKLQNLGKNLLAVTKDKKVGLWKEDGTVLQEPIYTRIRPFKEGLAWASKGEKWGAIDSLGNTVIPFDYQSGQDFQQGTALAKKGDLAYFLDTKGEVLLPIKYDEIWRQGTERFKVKIGEKYGCIDMSGKEIVAIHHDKIEDCLGDFIVVRQDTMEAIIDLSKKEKPAFIYQDIQAPNFQKSAVAIAEQGDSLGLVNREGDFVLPPSYLRIKNKGDYYFSAIQKRGAPLELFNYQGKKVPLEKGMRVGRAQEDLLVIQQKGKIGLLTKEGEWLFKPIIERIASKQGDIFVVKMDGYFGMWRKVED